MAERILRLAATLRFEACADGRCRIVRRTGDAYAFSASQRALFAQLWRGLSATDINGEVEGHGALGGWLLSMRELGLVETAATRRDSDIPWTRAACADASFTPWTHAGFALWGLVLAGLCLDAILRKAFDPSLPNLSFARVAIVAAACCAWVVLHETAHCLAARRHGVKGRMEFFRHGMLAPHFHAPPTPKLAPARVRYSIYMAGPLLDGTIALLLLSATKIHSGLWFGWVSVVASVFSALSLLPLNDCDTRKAWDCIDRGGMPLGRGYRTFFFVYSAIAWLCLAMALVVGIEMLFRIVPVHGWHSPSH